MKVLLVSDYAVALGGAERMLFRLRDLLRARGHDARTFTSRAGGLAGADYTCLGTLGPFRTALQAANPDAAIKLRHVIRQFRPDVVVIKLFLTQLSPLVLTVLGRVPAIYHAVWYRAVCPTGTKLLPDRTPCRVAAGQACWRAGCVPLRDLVPLAGQMALWRRWQDRFARVVCNSECTRKVLTEGGIAPLDVIPNGVPVMPPRPPLQDPPTAIFTGRLEPEKGVDVLLHAFAATRMADARLLLAGDGREREALVDLAGRLGISSRVRWLGHLAGDALERASAAAWVQVVPSLWQEPFGLVTIEAAMRGTSVAASSTGASTEIVVDGETGVLIPPGDSAALARALDRVLADREYAETLGAAARRRALEHYTDDLYADRFVALLDQVRRA